MMELYKKLTSSGIFIEWKSRNRDSFICSYVMIQAPQFDFYNGDNTMTSFIMNNEIEIIENEEIYSKTKIKPLDLKKAASEEKAIDVVDVKKVRSLFLQANIETVPLLSTKNFLIVANISEADIDNPYNNKPV